MNRQAALEALLFVAEAPIRERDLARVLEIPPESVNTHLAELARRLQHEDRGIVLRFVAGGWRLFTKPEALPYLERLSTTDSVTRLSNAALEVLAVVAYRQPVTRGQVSELRGVDSASAIRTLVRRGLIEVTDHLSIPGNPAVYSTTDLFLENLGIGDLTELPPLAEHMPDGDVAESLDHSPAG